MIDDFNEGGILARNINMFTPREAQRLMANKISNAISESEHLIIEAGTGTGKTFAYLVPALRSKKKVIISTGSKNLQDQLFKKDLPLIKKALEFKGHITLLKGRSNYLCLDRLSSQFSAAYGLTKTQQTELVAVRKWATQTKSGDISHCIDVSENSEIWSALTTTNDNCLGSECPSFENCFVVKARRQALAADVIVVNHHLFLADIVLKDTGFGELLPKADVMIFDEAHQIPDLACHYFGEQLSSKSLFDLSKEIMLAYRTEIKDVAQLQKCSDSLATAVQDFRLTLSEDNKARENLRYLFQKQEIMNHYERLVSALNFCQEVLILIQGRSKTLDKCDERIREYLQFLARVKQTDIIGFSYWCDINGRSFILYMTPLSVEQKFADLMKSRGGSWIFTSATLSVNQNLNYFLHRLGLNQAEQLILDSPFDYSKQTILCVPQDIPEPNHAHFSDAIVKSLTPVINANKGRCFILCTSYFMMNKLAEQFRKTLAFDVLVQGEKGKNELLNQFVKNGNAVLIATQSFWEGIDVQGDALSLVIIDKLPFASPDDPLIKARIEDIRLQGHDPFYTLQIPEAVIALKQGVGRLIRHHNDHGVIILCDNRVITKAYGKIFVKSIPPSPKTRDLNKVINFLLNNPKNQS